MHEPEFILADADADADAGTGLRRGIADYFRTAVLGPSLFHIHEVLAEALNEKNPRRRGAHRHRQGAALAAG